MLSIRSESRRRSVARGFTLVEILIVVIILGILAAIVIPQFTNASTDAKKSNMASQDQTIKSQISLYMLQHNDTAPALSGGGLGDASWDALCSTSVVGSTTFGPYLPNAPVNPLTNSSTVVTFTPGTAPTASTANGWYYYATTGEFHGADSLGGMSDDGTNEITQ